MCSIGEDDFGDEGGLHSMVKDDESKEFNSTTGICSKCGAEERLFKLKFREPECSSCFLAYARHKFRAILGSSKILPKGAEVLLHFDGSAESIVLLDMMHFAQKQNAFKRLHVDTKILFIDESPICKFINVEKVKQFLADYEFESYGVSLASNETICHLQEFNPSDIDSKEFESAISSIKTLTSRQDFIKISKNRTIQAAAQKLKCEYVFLPDISTNLATELINSIALGRGGSAALDVSLLDDRLCGVKLLRPLKNLSVNEINLYLKVRDLKPLKMESYGEASGPNASIQNLTRHFVNDLQENFSSTISTIFRTGDKIACFNKSSEECSICALCKSRLNNTPSKTLQALEFSSLASAFSGNLDRYETNPNTQIDNFSDELCHACANIQSETENVILTR